MKRTLGAFGVLAFAIPACTAIALAQRVPSTRGVDLPRNLQLPAVEAHNDGTQQTQPALNITWGICTYPGSVGSLVSAVSKSGHIVGGYGPNINSSTPTNHGYLLKGMKFTSFDYPGAVYTQPNGASPSEVIVGAYGTSLFSADEHGFKLVGKKFTAIHFPGATEGTLATGINKSGDIVGTWGDSTTNHGFLLSKGVFTSIDCPGAFYTGAWGINSAGDSVGWYGANFDESHGFIYSKGKFTSLDYPGYSQNYVADIDDSGVIVGGFGDDTIVNGLDYQWQHCCIYQNGQFTTFDAPFGPAAATFAWHLNNDGVVTGYDIDTTSTAYGFMATVGP